MNDFFLTVKPDDCFAENLLKKWVSIMEFKNPALVWVAMNRGRGLSSAGAAANRRREGVRQELKDKGAKYLSSGVFCMEKADIPESILSSRDKMIEVGPPKQIIPRAIRGFSCA